MAKMTKRKVDLANKRAARGRIDEKIKGLKARLLKESNRSKQLDLKAQIADLRYQRDQIKLRRKNGNGNGKKRGIF
jgi:hypothetical protein